MRVNPARCITCPFNDGADAHLRASVESRVMTQASQLCHETENTTLCRGARDFQLQIFFRMGFLSAPTDAAWAAKARTR